MIYIVKLNDKEYEVEVEKGKANITNVVEAAPIQKSTIPMQSNIDKSSMPLGDKPVYAPMPGTILSIQVEMGQRIKKGDLILVLEAMKMENEIMATEDGIVHRLLVKTGDSVATNDILVTLE